MEATGTVVLLFRMRVKSDSGEVWECDCAMIDVLYDLQTPRCTCRVISLVALQCISGHLIQVYPGPGVH